MESHNRNGKRRKIKRIEDEPLFFLKSASIVSSYFTAIISSISELTHVLFQTTLMWLI